ncbi:glutathione S-transferase N-terminal domain-containing protein [Hephaestia mangrovi]|uniref:glutathione S-transferase N-terminal domain-containing protein n=1 Tax=Hephaestia mangrovi TaxID=2873268 RepID=UPI001CA71624|nr:glutathione S-transferase N-terminal domain-containing protein [Hephaestia mangrovi]MBY8828328.1 glutathione S-transferase N-terminal domain-containing protein [Hephaestia mangrovi]
MRLYFYPAACSIADHIALIEADLPYDLMPIDRDKRTRDGRDYLAINPRGFVPALELDDGSILTENLAILAHIADHSGKLLPEDALGRSRALEALSYMATTIHGGLGPFFKRAAEAEQTTARNALTKAFAFLDEQMGEKPFLLGQSISIADPYLYWCLLAAAQFEIATPARLQVFFERMNHRPSVVRARAEEGLAPAK